MNQTEVIKKFSQLISFQSVSTDSKYANEIKKTVNFLKNWLESLDFKVRIISKNNSSPLIIGSFFKKKNQLTIGIYGHYDVQPADPISQWQTSPFELILKNGKFFGRGVADNKGHIIQNLAAITSLIKEKKLKNNIVFIFEGEEETGSINFESLVDKAKDILSLVDVFYITDTGMHRKNQPQIFYGLRGIVYFQLTIKIGSHDLHSGVYGNRVYNPINVLADLIVKIKDTKTGKIKIPHFYDDFRKPDKTEFLFLKKTLKTNKEEINEAGVFGLTEIENFGSISSKIFPSFDCHGILSGYTKEGLKTIIPNQAMVKFSFRLVENQDPEKIEKLVFDFVKKNLSKEVKWDLRCLSKSSPFYTDVNNKLVKKTAEILKKVFKNEVLFNRSGGSVPAAEVFQRLFKKPIILTGFTLPDDNVHVPNENFDKEMFWMGIEALKKIYNFNYE
ncbi:MAG: M20/M25/M40 family metallo-hydrolase [Patescibacteria group bacterium]|nr:M20/M25/M40 family metallo-hydrolase [Patescibacteria group bacterium]